MTQDSNKTASTLKTFLIAGVSLGAIVLNSSAGAMANDDINRFNIKAGDLKSALDIYIDQSGKQLIYRDDQVQEFATSGTAGVLTNEEALLQVLAGSNLIIREDPSGAILIADGDSGLQAISFISDEEHESKLGVYEEDEKRGEVEGLEEIVIIGSHIRGAKTASPIFIYDREDIEKTGLSTLPQFIRTLPQVFGGGASDGNAGIAGTNNSNLNVGGGSGVNLRGLGTDSTLVLLDGRRMAGAGLSGGFVDISMIPLTALERVEVLTDGASAIYGSDAVGGVINFIMRDNYEGAETYFRYGSVTEGSSDDIKLGQVIGTAWDSGSGLISYEFSQRNALDSGDRSFSKNAEEPTDLLAKQIRHSVFAKAGQYITEQVKLFGTVFYSHRKSLHHQTRLGNTFLTSPYNENYGATIGLQTDFGDSWRGEVVGTYNQDETFDQTLTFSIPFDPSNTPIREIETKVTSIVKAIDAKADGTIFQLEGGEVKVAIGGQYRREQFINPGKLLDTDRKNYAVFGELFIPLISDNNKKSGFERLELTLATRYEYYSNFGSSTNPKVGLLWSPVSGFNLRGTYGTSFRAPLLNELSEFNLFSVLFSIPDPLDPLQQIPGMIYGGNNASLQPETATTWTAGFDLKPVSAPGLNIGVTYFNIKYENRIGTPNAFIDGFSDPRFASLVTRNPDPELVAFLTSGSSFPFYNLSPFDPADTKIIFDQRLRNLATVNTSGLDFSISYALETERGDWNFTLNSTYLIEHLRQVTEVSDPFDVVNTAFNPAALKINGGIYWNKDGFATSLLVNHINAYKDDRESPAIDVNSWTTVDLNLSYNTKDRYDSTWLRDTKFSLTIQNLLDQDPPFVKSFFNAGINFDPDNATSLGRFIAFQITRKW